MRTSALVDLLAADGGRRRSLLPPALPLLAGIALATLLFAAWLGPRPDIASALPTPRFLLKLTVTIALAITAGVAVARLWRPGGRVGPWAATLALGPALLAVGAVAELALLPASDWPAVAIGSNAAICLRTIPILALAPLVGGMWTLRRGAPSRTGLAGAAVGLLAGSVGAALYATMCTDDSPLFVALWYPIAIGAVTALGAIAARLVARW